MPKSKSRHASEIDLINNHRSSYDVVILSSIWAKHLKKKEEFKNKPAAEVIKAAMQEVCLGKVTREEIEALSDSNEVKKERAKSTKDTEIKK